MAKQLLSFKIGERLGNEETYRYVNELRSRVRVVQRLFTLAAANRALEIINEKLPPGKEYDELRDLLVVREVIGIDPDTESAAAVVAKTSAVRRAVRELPQDRTLLIVGRPNPRLSPPPEEVFVLRAHNPWTVDTIPLVPERSVAKTRFRVVTKNEVDRIRDQRIAEMGKVLDQLVSVGIRLSGEERNRLQEVSVEGDPLQDLVKASLSTEFGLPGFASAPHWRPAQREVRHSFPTEFFLLNSDIRKTLFDPEFRRWKNLERTRLRRSIGTKRAEGLKSFQDKVRIK